MSKLITQIKRFALALCLATPIVSWAAPTATAVWRSNLGQSYTIGGNTYALTIPSDETKASGVLNQDGTVTLTNEWTGLAAPYFDLSATGTENVSVLVKFSGLSIPASGEYGTGLAGVLDSDGNEVGAYVQPGETSLCAFYRASGVQTPTQIRINDSDDAVVADGYMLFSYSASSGVKAYVGGTIETLIGGEKTSYNYSNRTISRLLIGGDNGKYYNPNGFTIEDVAVFVGSYLSNGDVADYVFPTVTIDPEITTMSALNTKVAALDNEFLYFSSAATVYLDAEPENATQTFLQSANWNGTVLIKDVDKNNIIPTKYGNPNSTLKLSGVKGYFNNAKYGIAVTPAIELENSTSSGREYGFHQYDGYGFNSYNGYPRVNTPELKGSGIYKCDKNNGLKSLLVADKFSNFSGIIDLTPSGSNGTPSGSIWLGASVPAENDDSVTPGTIYLGTSVPSNYSTWTVPNGYYGTVEVAADATADASALFATSAWKGTVVVPEATNSTGNHIRIRLDLLGNANSIVRFNGLSSNTKDFYLNSGDSPTYNTTVDINGWVAINNGSSGKTITLTRVTCSNEGATLRLKFPGTAEINYVITTLDQFAGTLSVSGYTPLTIGTINLATAPVAGAKVVKLASGSYLKNVGSIKVSVNGVVDDTIELEQKEDGLYVVEPVVNVAYIEATDTSYTTMAAAIADSMNGSRVITLLANVDEAYELASDGRLKVALAGYTWTGLTAPTGYQINAAYSEATGVTTYTCVEIFVAKARIGTTEGQNEYVSVDAALEAVLSLNMAVGTVVYVLDENYVRSSTSATLQQYFTWNGSASPRTWTRKATTNGEGSQTVAAGSALDACNAVTVLPTNSDVENALQGYSYASYFQKTAVETSEGSGVWTVTVTLSKAQVFEGDAAETATLTDTLDGVLDGEADEITIPAKRGLYYSFASGTEVTDLEEGDRVLATGTTVTLDKVEGDAFYQVLVHTAPKQAVITE